MRGSSLLTEERGFKFQPLLCSAEQVPNSLSLLWRLNQEDEFGCVLMCPSLEPKSTNASKNDLLNEVESSSSTQTGSTDGTVSLFNITVPRTVLLSLSKKSNVRKTSQQASSSHTHKHVHVLLMTSENYSFNTHLSWCKFTDLLFNTVSVINN